MCLLLVLGISFKDQFDSFYYEPGSLFCLFWSVFGYKKVFFGLLFFQSIFSTIDLSFYMF